MSRKLSHHLYEHLEAVFMQPMVDWLIATYDDSFPNKSILPAEYAAVAALFGRQLAQRVEQALIERQQPEARTNSELARLNLVKPETIAEQHEIPLDVLRDLWNQGLIESEFVSIERIRDGWPYVLFPADVTIDDEIRSKGRMSRLSALEFLNTSEYKFNKLKKQLQIKPAGRYKTESGQWAHLYSLADVEIMKALMS
jgi:hypothetical protein